MNGEGKSSKPKILLIISLILMLLSGVVVSAVQTNMGKVTMKELNIETDSGYSMSAYLLVPDTATAENPAPGIVTSHGYLNNKEMTDANYVELARRGYVVLAIDQPDHGDSEITESFNLMQPDGVYQGVLALSRMPFVDTEKIGITGHSMGSWSCNAAIAADNAAETQLISAVLIHCNEPVYTDDDGNYTNIYGDRNAGVISAVYDEFFGKSTAEDGSSLSSPYWMDAPGTQSFLNFGADPETAETREAYTYYTETMDGKEVFRVIYRPEISHAWSHFSARSESYVIDFFERALGAPNPIDSGNQIWQWKEAFNLVGLVGFVLFICSFGVLLLYTPVFEKLRAPELVQPRAITDGKGKALFWISLLATCAFGCIVFLPIMAKSNTMAVSQVMPMGMGLWGTLCGLFSIAVMVISYRVYGKNHGLDLEQTGVKLPAKKLGLSILLAVIIVAVAYGCVFVADYFFLSDFRIWTLAIKAFEAPILKYLPYVLLFLVYYIAISVSTNCFNYSTAGGRLNGFICAVLTAGPAWILPLIQYGTYFSAKHMMWAQVDMASPNYPMFIIGLFPLILLIAGTTLMSRYIYKRTANPYIAGIVNALIAGLFAITNTCTTF